MTTKTQMTYVVRATSTHRYGLNQDYYFRTEGEANRRANELKAQFADYPNQKIEITSHPLVA